MLLVHVGRKTGVRRRTPLNYAVVAQDIYCVAAFGKISDWHKNILECREVEVWLPDGWWSGIATDVSNSDSRLPLLRKVLIASGFAAYAAGIRPTTMSDAELARLTVDYRVLRIARTHRSEWPRRPVLGLARCDASVVGGARTPLARVE